MYSNEDILRAKRFVKKFAFISGSVLLLTAAAFCVCLAFRARIPALALLVVGGWAVYYLIATKLAPWVYYLGFLQDATRGLSHKMTAQFLSCDDTPRQSGHISVYDFEVYVDGKEDDTRLFLWDAEKPLQTFEKGQTLEIDSFGNHIRDVRVVS